MSAADSSPATLLLGIGNVLMGDEGIGVHVVNHLATLSLPPTIECLDGGTGGFALLGAMRDAGRVVMVDATIDGGPTGRVRRLRPRFSAEYPRTLTAHDIGLKDLLDVFHLTDRVPDVTLFAVSIDAVPEVGAALSPGLAAHVPEIATLVLQEVGIRLAVPERPALDAVPS